jgi:hypothetical protein
MKPKTKFIKDCYRFPEKARRRLTYLNYEKVGEHGEIIQRNLSDCLREVRNDTELGRQILKDLGYD